MAREFIPNITTANEEIVRLDTALAALNETSAKLVKAEADLVAAQALLDAAVKPEALAAAELAKKTADEALVKANADHAVAIKELQDKVDAGSKATLEAAAAAGVTPVVDAKTTGIDLADDKGKNAGLTGLARAIAGNIDLQAARAAK